MWKLRHEGIEAWVYEGIGACRQVCMEAWVHEDMEAWVHGGMRSWGYGCTGEYGHLGMVA